jgi:prophage antirepressor-like protein
MIFSQPPNKPPVKQLEVKSKEVFSNEMFGELTVIRNEKDEIFFIGKEVAEKLGYVDTTQAIRKHCKGGVETTLPTAGGMQTMKVIPESDVYRLVMRSKLEEAEKFQDWVVEEVLPSIRKRGMYATDNVVDKFLADPDFAIKLLTEYKEEKQKRLEAEQLQREAEEKVQLLTHVEKMYTATEVGKECGFQSAIALNNFLVEQKVQYKVNDTWVPYSEYANKGYFHLKQEILDTGKVIYHRKITQLGREFIINLVNEKGS